ncbi:Rgp1-domain-containing protein [Roridomyces roridus]|uniref:Rgp1-domain-containing protein n=1 Tax=Roridomyces roridus TaxID=1738132 RepID=A0AAD7FUK8_9AGAR|nr:Rgp1-domain-containing protein [Roridomyces roridus]
MTDTDVVDSPVRIVVTPSQSSYFAGEPFSVTVTFTNTLSPAMMGSLPALVELRRKKMLAKSLSVTIAPPDLEMLSNGAAPRSATFVPESPVSPPPPSSIPRRSDSFALAASHPHARKHSVLDGVAQVETVGSPISPKPRSNTSPLSQHARKHSAFDGMAQVPLQEILASPISPGNARAQTPSASSSTFSLALDPIAESAVYPYPPTSESSVALPVSSSTPTRAYPPRRSSHADLGHGPPPIPPRMGGSQTANFAPNTELLLYAYVSLSGRVVISPLSGAATPALSSLRTTLRRPARGGGSLSLQAASGGVGGLGLGRHRRSSSFSAGLRALVWGGRPAGAGAGAEGESGEGVDGDPEMPLPTLEVPPEMLAVDLVLAPGESRSYTYTLPLPSNLPPTFKGRTLRFSYELVVGACRAPPGGKGGGGSISRVMKVPIRVYNNVDVARPPKPYDLRWPVARRIASPRGAQDDNPRGHVEETRASAVPQQTHKPDEGNMSDLSLYAERLFASTAGGLSLGDDGADGKGGGLSGCREAVEVLTRNLKKMSYDITKDGVTVAVLTFPKSAFRLGETVHGAVEVNWREGRGRVLQLTALLEAHESLPSALAAPPSTPATARYLRRVHAEHHARFVLGTLRLGFALDIPSDGSPAFGVTASSDGSNNTGGLEWRVRLCLLVGVTSAGSDTGTEGVRAKGLVQDADDESGRGAWGSAWRAPAKLGVLERTPTPPPRSPPTPVNDKPSGWGAFFAASFLGAREGGYHDGDDFEEEEDGSGRRSEEEEAYAYDGVKSDPGGGVGVGVRYGGREAGWGEVKAEMVECVVPVRVWAGNTAFRAGDVVFDV